MRSTVLSLLSWPWPWLILGYQVFLKMSKELLAIPTPPSRACGVCRNRLNEVCVEDCSMTKDYRYFDPDMEFPADLIPTLTFKEYQALTGSMKGKWLFYQQSKIWEVLSGRHDFDNTRGRRIPKNIKGKDLLSGAEKRAPSHSDWKECKDFGERTIYLDPIKKKE